MMKKEKKHKYVASDWYEFDEEKEKNIYLYVCGKKLKKRVEKNMDENVKFKLHSQWENYVKEKYKDYSDERLEDFSCFLNQRGRNVKPLRKYLVIIFPILFTMICDHVYEWMQDMNKLDLNTPLLIITGIVAYFVVIVVCVSILIKLINDLLKASDTEYFLMDYKVIIDNMIKERQKYL